jgi:hypothetical protein
MDDEARQLLANVAKRLRYALLHETTYQPPTSTSEVRTTLRKDVREITEEIESRLRQDEALRAQK